MNETAPYDSSTTPVLSHDDPPPLSFLPSAANDYPIVLVCDHAGNLVPKRLRENAPSPHLMKSHIAIDVGARQLAIKIASLLELPLVMQRYSRLVIDCNRPLHAPDLIPETSDGVAIRMNQNLTDSQIKDRWNSIHRPYHLFISDLLDSRSDHGSGRGFLAVHSFTPQLHNAPPRSWHMDVMRRNSSKFVEHFLTSLRHRMPDYQIGFQKVFQIGDDVDYTLPFHGEIEKVPLHASLEVRNDLLQSDEAIDRMANVITRCLYTALAKELGNNSYIERLQAFGR